MLQAELGTKPRAAANYGDFKFDQLPENSGDYELEIWAGNGAKTSVRANLARSFMSARYGCSRRPDTR